MSFAGPNLIEELTKAYEKTPWDAGVFNTLYDAYLEAGQQPPAEMRRQRIRERTEAGALEREWKKDRNHTAYEALTAIFKEFGLEPKDEFERLAAEVALDVEREIYEELSGEHGNFNRESWKVYVLSEEKPYEATQFVKVPFRNERGEQLIADVALRTADDSRGTEIYEIRRPDRHYVSRADAGQFNYDAVIRAATSQRVAQEKPTVVLPDGTELWRQRHYESKEFEPDDRGFVLDGAPEWLQSELESEYERDDGLTPEFCTVYGAGGAYLQDVKNPAEVWQLVREQGLGEHECPLRHWDPQAREDSRGVRLVTETDTHYGNRPGEACILCDEQIGEEHGYLYMGEGAEEFVYMKVVRELPSQIDTHEIEAQVREAFRVSGLLMESGEFETFFEHGQWFVRLEWEDERSDNVVERTYSVVDTQDGFGFEEV